jgi:hypothetical protein
LIWDCGGHPATLETLATLLQGKTKMKYDKRDYHTLFKDLIDHSKQSRLSIGTSIQYIRYPLENDLVNISKVLLGIPEKRSKMTLRQLIAAGYYIGTTINPENQEEAPDLIPQIIPLQLYKFASITKKPYPDFYEAVKLIFESEDKNFIGKSFEQWHLGN